MTTHLVDHLRTPNGVPEPEGLRYLESVEATFTPYGARWLVLDAPVVLLEGTWPGSVPGGDRWARRCRRPRCRRAPG